MTLDQNEELSIDHLFRHHSGQMIAVLVRIFGIDQIDQIEDAVQDSLLKALKRWPIYGVPEKPLPWLIQVAKNGVYDKLRRDGKMQSSDDLDPGTVEQNEVFFENELSEDQLRLIFACCHPSISADSQIAITLKTVGGFSNKEIASAFLAKKTTIDKLVTRAKGKLKQHRESVTIPSAEKLPGRIGAVVKVLYLMFNEGYMASGGSEILRRDLCREAIRLAEILESHPKTSGPTVNALLALFYFQSSRFESRTDTSGMPILLPDQNRSTWDKALIRKGLVQLTESARGENLTSYHLEAEIASIHAVAEDYESTDWERILDCYRLLEDITGSPVVALNRIYALSRTGRIEEAFEQLSDYQKFDFEGLYQYFLVKAELAKDLGQDSLARKSYERVSEMTDNEAIRKYVRAKI